MKGVLIGSPMAGVLAELVIRDKELQILNQLNLDLLFYKRYVDDDFAIWGKKDKTKD